MLKKSKSFNKIISKNNNKKIQNKSREIEEEMFKASLEVEKEIAKKYLKEIADSFPEEFMIKDGVKYYRIEREKDVHIGRISVLWTRPIFEGSIKGKTVYIYPADDSLAPPKKGRASYETLSFSSLLSTFVPYKIVSMMLSEIRGAKVPEASIQRYAESTGQFAIENLEEIIKSKKDEIILTEDEILIASIDGSSSMINGNNLRSLMKSKKKIRVIKRRRTRNDIRQERRLEEILRNVNF